jgi:4a-hydroxytetrahydrobiopterin dehydratase
MAPEPLSPQEIAQAVGALPGWSASGDHLRRTYTFTGHLPAAAMVMHVCAVQEEMNHHAELTLGHHTLDIAVNTHTVGRVTALDVALARRVQQIAAGHGAV